MATSKRRIEMKQQDWVQILFKERVINEFFNTATSIFKWKLDEDKFNNRVLNNEVERLLFMNGMCTIYKGRDGVIRARAVGGSIVFNENMDYIKWKAVSKNGRSFHDVSIRNGVIVYNNKAHTATRAFIADIVDDMLNTDITIRQQLNAMKTPFVFYGDESDILQFKIEYNKLINGEGVFFRDKAHKNMQTNKPFEVFVSDVQYKCDKLMDLYDKYENRILKYIGLQANYIEKKAQMQDSEVNKGDDIILLNFDAFHSERREALEILNDTIGIKGTLEINEYLIKQRQEEPKKEVKTNEQNEQKKE